MQRVMIQALVGLALSVSASAAMADRPVTSKSTKDPNEKVCETQGVLGSRLAVRRVCATRAEWAERKARERDIIDRTQVQQCVPDGMTGLCSK